MHVNGRRGTAIPAGEADRATPCKEAGTPCKAIPEDVQEVVRNFRSIADEASGMVRGYLKKAPAEAWEGITGCS